MYTEMMMSGSGGKVASGEETTAATLTINCGFKPNKVYLTSRKAYTRVAIYDEDLGMDLSAYRTNIYVTGSSGITINDTGFTASIPHVSYWTQTVWIATAD